MFSVGLFVIIGLIGVGKSIVLDVLCLVLFGSMLWLESILVSSKVFDGWNELFSNDECNLLCCGCVSGYVEVDFVGIDGYCYCVCWEIWCFWDKVDGVL